MIGDTLTIENLLSIFQAMDRIKPIDRSDYFNQYYQEVVSRLQDERKIQGYIESQLSKVQNKQETDGGVKTRVFDNNRLVPTSYTRKQYLG